METSKIFSKLLLGQYLSITKFDICVTKVESRDCTVEQFVHCHNLWTNNTISRLCIQETTLPLRSMWILSPIPIHYTTKFYHCTFTLQCSSALYYCSLGVHFNTALELVALLLNLHPKLDTRFSVRPPPSRSGYPPWILKRGGLESSGRIPSS